MTTGHADIDNDPLLLEILQESRQRGFLGPGAVEEHLRHAAIFLPPLVGVDRCLDLGSGGGLPGLALVRWRPDMDVVLVDAAKKRCEFLTEAVECLDASDRVQVYCGRAEELARDPGLRRAFSVVVARSFGPPAVTAECAVGFLRGPGARLVVSEPPEDRPDRWPEPGLGQLGLVLGRRERDAGATVQILEMSAEVSDRWPRRDGVPSKRPLF